MGRRYCLMSILLLHFKLYLQRSYSQANCVSNRPNFLSFSQKNVDAASGWYKSSSKAESLFVPADLKKMKLVVLMAAIQSVYCADTIAEVKLLISPFLR